MGCTVIQIQDHLSSLDYGDSEWVSYLFKVVEGEHPSSIVGMGLFQTYQSGMWIVRVLYRVDFAFQIGEVKSPI